MMAQFKRMMTAVTLAFASACMVFAFQNCSEFAVDGQRMSQFASLGATSSAGAVLVPETDKIDSACRTSAAYDACVLQQNPLAGTVTQLSVDPSARRTQLAGEALYGVKLTSLDGSGQLSNSTLKVRSVTTAPVTTIPAALKAPPGVAGSSNFEQVNVYYWMNRAAEYFDARTSGALPAKGKGVIVVVEDTITGYEPATNTIRMKSTESLGSVAWNGDLAVHLFGLANLHLANPAGWATLSAAKHTTCNAIDKGCCASNIGCANAIRFGVGEYFAASLFPTRTRIGAGLVNTGNAQIIAGVQRDVASLAASTAPTVFTTSVGHAQAMGLIYSSIWWQVRAAAAADSAEIDRIFIEHLTLLDGNDDFRTAIAKAKTIDARLFSGRHSAKFDSQLTARGL